MVQFYFFPIQTTDISPKSINYFTSWSKGPYISREAKKVYIVHEPASTMFRLLHRQVFFLYCFTLSEAPVASKLLLFFYHANVPRIEGSFKFIYLAIHVSKFDLVPL